MRPTHLQAAADRRTSRTRRDLVDQLRLLVGDAGVTVRALGEASGLSPQYVARILAGTERPTLEAYGRLAATLGADLHVRFYPNTGFTELAVGAPSRGWIDVAFHEPRERVVVATQIEEGLRRLEQLVRWSEAKAASLPSREGWARLGDAPAISRLLVVRRTRAHRRIAGEFSRQLRVAYPAHPDDAIASLTRTTPWPGAALVGVTEEAGGGRRGGPVIRRPGLAPEGVRTPRSKASASTSK